MDAGMHVCMYGFIYIYIHVYIYAFFFTSSHLLRCRAWRGPSRHPVPFRTSLLGGLRI